MTETAKTIAIAVVAAVAFLLLVASCQADEQAREESREEFNSWLSECIGQEGTPVITHAQRDGSNWYECMVDGVEVQIP